MTGDAHHITQPAEDGDGAYRVMRKTLQSARVKLADALCDTRLRPKRVFDMAGVQSLPSLERVSVK